jgi:hypothetical protein
MRPADDESGLVQPVSQLHNAVDALGNTIDGRPTGFGPAMLGGDLQ